MGVPAAAREVSPVIERDPARLTLIILQTLKVARNRRVFIRKLNHAVAGKNLAEWESRRSEGGAQLCFAAVFNDIAVAHDYPVEIPSEDRR